MPSPRPINRQWPRCAAVASRRRGNHSSGAEFCSQPPSRHAASYRQSARQPPPHQIVAPNLPYPASCKTSRLPMPRPHNLINSRPAFTIKLLGRNVIFRYIVFPFAMETGFVGYKHRIHRSLPRAIGGSVLRHIPERADPAGRQHEHRTGRRQDI